MTWKLYARETLMCGLRQIPIAGQAVDIVEKVGERRAQLDLAEDVAAIREELTGFQSGMRDLVEKTIREAMDVFARPQIDPGMLSQLIDEVRQLNDYGYHTAVFDGLFQRSAHYEELKRRPENYGRLLDDSEAFPTGQLPVFVDFDKTRLVAIPPAMLWTLLSNTHDVDSHVESSNDVWALPETKVVVPSPHPEERAQPASRRMEAHPLPDDPFREERERIARLMREAEEAEEQAKRVAAERRRQKAEQQEPQRLAKLEAEAQRRVWEAQRRAGIWTPLSAFRDTLRLGGEGPELVVIPAGSFLMGSPADEPERDRDEGPQTHITLQSFALGKYAVTFEEYDQFCDHTQHDNPDDRGWGLGRRPVININIDGAKAYCAWLSKQTGAEYRLPSEAEWEYACRAGSETPFEPTVAHSHGGRTITPDEANYDGNYTYNGSNKGEYRRKTVPVDYDGFRANAWGLWQMHGNVWEWCEDCWNDSYAERPTDNSVWRSGDCAMSIIRGGSWDLRPQVLRSAKRARSRGKDRGNTLSFRVARTLP